MNIDIITAIILAGLSVDDKSKTIQVISCYVTSVFKHSQSELSI